MGVWVGEPPPPPPVFGVSVPGNEGKAGMASLTLSAGAVLDAATLASLYAHVAHELPAYARPLFLRVRADEVRPPGHRPTLSFAAAT